MILSIIACIIGTILGALAFVKDTLVLTCGTTTSILAQGQYIVNTYSELALFQPRSEM